jgi:carbonic anhydrase
LHDAVVRVKGFTVQVDFKEQSRDNYFDTQIGPAEFYGKSKMNAAQFHFHAKSEHTIDGQQFDFEMHTVHLPEN